MSPETLFAILFTFEAGSSVTGFIYFKKVKQLKLGWFPFYLAFIACADLTGELLRVYNFQAVNKVLYNDIVIPVEFLFVFRLFHQSFKESRYRHLPMACTIIYLAAWVIDSFFISNKQFWFLSFSYTIGNLLLLVLILRFFLQLINSDDILTFRQNALFWVSLGLLLFYLGSFPYFGLFNVILSRRYHKVFFAYYYITNVLDCLMYGMFAISFVWGRPQLRSSSL